jgi:hypothetical protein
MATLRRADTFDVAVMFQILEIFSHGGGTEVQLFREFGSSDLWILSHGLHYGGAFFTQPFTQPRLGDKWGRSSFQHFPMATPVSHEHARLP